MPTCANCNMPTDFSNSIEHPDPFKNQWLCVTCVKELTGQVQPSLKPPKQATGNI